MTETQDKLCVYCQEVVGSTDDHVPPALLFPKPRPSDLITVPACPQCNAGFEKDEEYIRALFRFGDGGLSEAMTQIGPKVDKQLLR